MRLFSGLRCAVLSTRRVWRGVIQSDQATLAGERVEVVLVAVRALGDLDQHPLREPALEVEHHHLVRLAGQRDAAACGAHRRGRQQARHFLAEQGLDAGGAGQKQGQGHRGGKA